MLGRIHFLLHMNKQAINLYTTAVILIAIAALVVLNARGKFGEHSALISFWFGTMILPQVTLIFSKCSEYGVDKIIRRAPYLIFVCVFTLYVGLVCATFSFDGYFKTEIGNIFNNMLFQCATFAFSVGFGHIIGVCVNSCFADARP